MGTRPTNPRPRATRPAFTLVEVMISVALVLVIILGVNQVFALTSQAVGSGNALSTITRDARNVQPVFYRDLTNAEIDRAPYFIIKSEALAAFRNRQEMLADKDFLITDRNQTRTDRRIRTVDRNGDGVEVAAEVTPRCFMTSRTHRADQLIFFTRSPARRQTGEANTFASNIASTEQYVSYGLLRQPGTDGTMKNALQPGIVPTPGVTTAGGCETAITNPNNYFATQWVLGRNVLLLKEPEVTTSNTKVVVDYTQTPPKAVTYYGRDPTAIAKSFAPLAQSTQSTKTGLAGNFNSQEMIQWSDYDLVGTSISEYRENVMIPAIAAYGTGTPKWYDDPANDNLIFRFAGFPTPTRPLTSQGVARTVPCFVRRCTQFAVEYAGDFLAQNPSTGAVTGVATGNGDGTDGEIDYIVQTYKLNGQTQTSRRIRWYGFPRDTNGALDAYPVNDPRIGTADKPDGFVYAEDDVVPLRDVAGAALPFERLLPTTSLPPKKAGTPRPTSPDYSFFSGTTEALAAGAQYRCIWGPDTTGFPRPRLVRITMAIDDADARIGTEQYFEYVIELPQ